MTDGLTVRSETSTYNGFNQLTGQTLNEAGIITDLGYEYYPDGIRGVKTVDSIPTVYLVNSGYVVAEYRGSTLTSVYLWGANLIKAGIGSETSYYLKEGEEEKSEWKDGSNGVKETQEGWLNGTELPDGTKVWDTGEVVRTKGETAVRVHSDPAGFIHGYPVRAGRYHAIN